jgi:EAL domain-containing protein (putative c-di-GMP-specific phosphodiesterase class I)/GGDEF domain-containing protein
MSMYRQLWLAIIISTLLALFGSLFAATLSARAYLAEQLSMKNADNATALALSLSGRNPDAVEVELAVSALFDSGHYELIRVTDPFGKVMVERHAAAGNGVPAWFAKALPIVAAPGHAQISSGWKQVGNIELVSHSRFAYQALWRSVLEMCAALAAAGLFGGYLGALVLGRLRKPLKAVIDQATAITERRFITIEEPKVPELSRLAGAMNAMVGRLKTMFDDEAARLEAVRREANCDPLTGLANRTHFLARLREDLTDEDCHGGALMLIRLVDLAAANHRLGRETTDDMICRIGNAIAQEAGKHPEAVAARLNGADFALLLPGMGDPRAVAESLLERIVAESEAFVVDGTTACVGIGRFPGGLDVGAVMAEIDTALAAAENRGGNVIAEAKFPIDEDAPRTAEQWTHLLQRALDHDSVRLISFPVVDMAGRLLHRECPLRLMLDDHGDWLPAGRFLPIAERVRLTPRIDLAAIALGLRQLEADAAIPGLAINLSASSLDDKDFRRQLIGRLQQHAKAASRLWLEVAETGAMHHLDAFHELVAACKGTGCRVGIEHFGRQSSQIGLLHDLGLDYLKIDAVFIRGLESNAGNQAFLSGLSSIAHGIGLIVIAEGVVSTAELEALRHAGFDGATGPAIRDEP